MRKFSEDFFVNGLPLLVPDEKLQLQFSDLDDDASGRDESGVMHRFVVRYKVPTWEFSYSYLTDEERRYMASLFPDAPDFAFTHPDHLTGEATVTRCYRSQFGICWRNARTGLWSGYSFRIIGC